MVAGYLGIDIHLASLPAIMRALHTTKAHVQQSVSIYLLGMGISMLFYGPLSDRYGRKPVVLFGLLIGAAFSFLCCLTQSIYPFLATRLFQGLGCGVCLGLGRTIIGDVVQGNRFIIVASKLSSLGAFVPLLAPALGGYLQHIFGWQANFLAFGIYILFAALTYGVLCPETHLHGHTFQLKAVFSHYREIFSHKTFVLVAFLSGITAAIPMVYAALSPFILQEGYLVHPVTYGWIISFLAMCTLIPRFFAGRMIQNLGRGRYLEFYVIFFFIGSLLFLGADLFKILSLPLFIFFSALTVMARIGTVFVYTAYAMEAFPTKRGTASSLYGSLQILIAFAVSGFVGLFSTDGVIVLVFSYVAMGAILLYFSRQFVKRII